MTKVLVIDNYDSFVYTLIGYLKQLGAHVDVIRNDSLTVPQFDEFYKDYDAIMISPGPGTPAEAGICQETVLWAAENDKPLIGVCLGHQAIGEAFGATVSHSKELMHGKTSTIEHVGSGLFDGIDQQIPVGRYHSLAIENETLPQEFEVTAWTANEIIMAMQHSSLPITSVQFHPESILTEKGYTMLGNWLESVGVQGAAHKAKFLNPVKSDTSS